ncbi:MAG: winged helix-turn-helix domain-containing protein [Acidobacteriota bacterium]|nr:MAG: winged helix-turn-helix domain-containing protein [Acidobacteriota bacterium]
MAKSNLFRHLGTIEVQKRFLGDNWKDYLLLTLDAHALADLSEQAVYDLLTERLLATCEQRDFPDRIIDRVSQLSDQIMRATDALIWQRSFFRAVRAVLGAEANYHLVVLFDQFDEVYRRLPPQFFVNLRGLRDEFKYRISYLVLTREELTRLNSAPECEEFYELFSANIFGLAPYNTADAQELLARVCGRYGTKLSTGVSKRLIRLTAGHPGLLKAGCLAVIKNNDLLSEEGDLQAVSTLLKVDDIRTECGKLWDSIPSDEQFVLKKLVDDPANASNDVNLIRRLLLKHLVKYQTVGMQPFNPVFAGYIGEHKAVSDQPAKLQVGHIKIDRAGDVWLADQLVSPQLTRKELDLLEYMCLEPGRLRSKDEVIAVVYPEEYRKGNIPSDDALNALVKRLRDRLEQTAGCGSCIVTVRGKGYRLELMPR